jgi:hypothetical protein
MLPRETTGDSSGVIKNTNVMNNGVNTSSRGGRTSNSSTTTNPTTTNTNTNLTANSNPTTSTTTTTTTTVPVRSRAELAAESMQLSTSIATTNAEVSV